MALSASKSTSKTEIPASSTKPSSSAAKQQSSVDSRKKNPRLQRSKSVSAVTRTCTKAPIGSEAGGLSVEQFSNKRDNPLFCCSSPSSPEHEGSADGCSSRRGRSVSRSFGYGRKQSTRSLSRREEDGECKEILSLRNETKDIYESKFQKTKGAASNGHGMLEQRQNLQRWSSRHPVFDYCNTSSSRNWEDGISISSLSELEETTIREHDHPSTIGGVGCIYEIVRSEVQRAVSEMKNDFENAIWRKSFTDSIVEVGPEIVNHDALELVSDIRMKYETMLMESHERTRKLRADLAVEEQREQEISRMLKEIIPDENSTPRKSPPRKKSSIERLEMSRRLTEDALSYFDECVSISTFDSSDFSSAEDQQQNSICIIPPLYGRSLTSDVSACTTHSTLNGLLNHPEEVEIQSQCHVNAVGSNLAAYSSLSSSQDVRLPLNGQKHDKLSNLSALLGGSIEISSVCEAANSSKSHDFRTYIKRFKKEPNRGAKNTEVSSSFNINDYDLDNSAESLLLDIVVLKNRIESGSLLLCDIRTF